MNKKILSTSLALLMMVNAVPNVMADEAAEVKNPTEYLVDISEHYNADTLIWGKKVTDGTVTREGDLVNDSWFNTGYNMQFENSVLKSYGSDGTTAIEIPKANLVKDETSGNYKVTNTGEKIPFKLNENNLRGDGEFSNGEGKDAVVMQETSLTEKQIYTIDLVQKPTDTLYMLYWTGKQLTTGVKQVIEYTDGTKDIFNYVPLEMGADTKTTSCEYFAGRYGWWLQRVLNDPYTDADGNKRANTAGTCGMALDMYALPVNSAKIPASITFYSFPSIGRNNSTLQVLYGLTQSAVSNEDMTAFTDSVKDVAVTYTNAGDIIKANNYADELIARNAATEADFTAIRAKKAAAEAILDYDLVPLDISNYYNKDTIGRVGESVADNADWSYHDNMILGDFLQSSLAQLDELKVVNNEGTYSFETTGTKIPFEISPEVTYGNAKNTVLVNSSNTINMDAAVIGGKHIADSLYVLAYGKGDLTVNAEYTDNTSRSDTYALSNERSAGGVASETAFAGEFTADAGVNKLGTVVAKVSDGAVIAGSGIPLLKMYKLNLNNSKKLKALTFTSSNSLYIYSITEKVMTNSRLNAYIDDVNGITTVTDDNMESIITANTYADELILRNAGVEADFEKVRDLYEEVGIIVNAEDPTERRIEMPCDTDIFFGIDSTNNTYEEKSSAFCYDGDLNVDISSWVKNNMLTFDVKPVRKNEDGTYSEGATTGTISFDFNAEKAHSDFIYNNVGRGLDTVGVLKGGSAKTVNMSGKATKEIYVLMPAHTAKELVVDANYADNTTEELTFTVDERKDLTGKESNTAYYARWLGWPSRVYSDKISPVEFELVVYKLALNPEKQIKSLTFNPSSVENYFVMGINETPVSNKEMKDYIKALNVEKVTLDNFESVLTANLYADELIERSAERESNLTALRALKQDAEFFAKMEDPQQYTWDLTNYFDVDTIANNGDALNETFVRLADENNLLGSLVLNQLKNGIKTLDEMKVVKDSSDAYVFENTGVTIPFAMNTDSLVGQVKDAIELNADKSVVIDAKTAGANERADSMYVLYFTNTYGTMNMRFNYSDGTWEDKAVKMTKLRDASSVQTYPNYAGYWYIGGWQKIKNVDNVATAVSGEPNLVYVKIDMDATKKLDSVRIGYEVDWGTDGLYIYSITTIPMSNNELQAGIEEARGLVAADEYGIAGYVDEENIEVAQAAAQYVYELEERYAAKASDYTDVFEIEKQAVAQKPEMIDISALYNNDIIVTAGDTTNLNKEGIYESSKIPETGIITLDPASNEGYDNGETGRSFKISGLTAGKNDSVLLSRVGTEISTGNKILKKIAFAFDTATTGTVQATIKYADGTSETLIAPAYDRDFYSTAQINPHFKVSQAQWNAESGAYEAASSMNYILSSFVEPTYMKAIESVIVANVNSYEVSMLAMTAVPYTNTELIALWDTMEFELVKSGDTVTADNAEAVIKGTAAALEMKARYYTMTAEEVSRIEALKTAAENIQPVSEVVFEKPEITIGAETVSTTVSMKNTTNADKNYIVILAAYDVNGSLIKLEMGKAAVLTANTQSAQSTAVTIPVQANATKYKAFVWENLSNIKPWSYSEK